MINYSSFLLIYIIIYLFFVTIRNVNAFEEELFSYITFKNIFFHNDTTFSFKELHGFHLYVDISLMKYKEIAVITVNIPYEITRFQLLLSFKAKVIHLHSTDKLINYFPINDKESQFEVENAFERRFNSEFKSIHHLYFNKTSIENNNVYLLLDMKFNKDKLFEFRSESLWISRISRIEDLTFSPAIGIAHFRKTLSAFVPYYVSFDLREKNKYQNLIFHCEENIMTVHYNNLLLNNKRINVERFFTQLASSDQYLSYEISPSIHKTFVVKFMFHENITLFKFEVGYMRNPLMIINPFSKFRMYSIEILKQNQKAFLVGINNLSSLSNDYFSVEPLYGLTKVHYASSFLISYIMNSITRLGDRLELIENVKKMDKHVNFIQISCSSPCRLNVILFTINPFNEIYSAGISYILLTANTEKDRVKVIFQGDFIAEIQGLTKQSIDIELYTNQTNDQLMSTEINSSITRKRFTIDEEIHHNSNTVSFAFISNYQSLVKMILYQEYQYTIVPLGKSEYRAESLIFILKPNPNIESYQIVLEVINNNDNINSNQSSFTYFNEYSGIGDDSFIPFPTTQSFSFLNTKLIVFSNPYNKMNQTIKDTEYKFYYYALRAFTDKQLRYTVNYEYIYKENNTIIEINTLHYYSSSSSESQFRKSLRPDYTLNTKLRLQFFKCSEERFDYLLWYSDKKLSQFWVINNRTDFVFDNYYVDYVINFTGNTTLGYSFLFSYSYCDSNDYAIVNQSNNFTIRAIDQGYNTILEWNKYLKNDNTPQQYFIYIKEYNNKDKIDLCNFVNTTPFDVLYYDNNRKAEGDVISYPIGNIKNGVYRIDIIVKETQRYYLTQIYDGIVITIKTSSLIIKKIMLFISFMLIFISGYLWSINKRITQKTNVSKRKYYTN